MFPPWFHDTVAVLVIVVGAAMALFGYTFFIINMIVMGSGAAGFPVFLYAYNNILFDDDNTALVFSGVFALLAAGIVGFLCWRLLKIGVFLMSASLGAVTAVLLHLTLFVRFLSAYGNIPLYVSFSVLSVGTGALGLVFVRPVSILSTSLLGAYAFVRGISMFIPGSFVNEIKLAELVQGGSPIPPSMGGYLGGIVAGALLGTLVQFFVTAKKQAGGKDDIEKELEDAEISLNALSGEFPSTPVPRFVMQRAIAKPLRLPPPLALPPSPIYPTHTQICHR